MRISRCAAGAVFLLALLGGCSSAPVAVEAPLVPIPEGCTRATALPAAPLRLSPAKAEASGLAGTSVLKVDRELTGLSDWGDLSGGWSLLNLSISAGDTRTLSLHLSQLKLPPRAELWFCSADRRTRQGPYRDATGGELWTPVVPGGNALLEVVLPSAARAGFAGHLAEVYVAP